MSNFNKFGTAINCIDGRVQAPVAEWIKLHGHVQYVDMITEPGVDKVLANDERETILTIFDKLRISIDAHQSKIVAVVGHFDCAANPISVEEHREQIEEGYNLFLSMGLGIRVVGLYVNEWNSIDVVCDSETDNQQMNSYL